MGENGGLAIPGVTEVREKQPSLLAVNPAYAGDETLLARIDKALAGIKGIPEDFIIQQDPVIETVVSETALERLFAHPAGVVSKALDLLGGLVFRPVFKDIGAAWDMVRGMLDGTGAEAKGQLRNMLQLSIEADAAPAARRRTASAA